MDTNDLLECDADRIDFRVGEHCAFILRPRGPLPRHRPWVWYAPTFVPRLPKHLHLWYADQILAAGIHLAGVDVGESWGNPAGRSVFTAFHTTCTQRYGLENRACLWPQSRGGLMHYNWAVEHPARVKCVAAIYALVNAVEPLRDQICAAHGLSAEQFAAAREQHNPVDRIRPLAEAGVPICHLHGDADTVVPFADNAEELVGRYRGFGGGAELMAVPGKGHAEIPEFFHCQAFADWLIRRALAS